MPQTVVTRLPKSEVKIEFVVSQEEATPYLEEAAKALSQARPLPGFRPGHVTFTEAKRAYGEMALLEQALERIVRAFYVKTLLQEGIATIASPTVNVDQLVPGQEIKFHTITPTEPVVTSIPALTACEVTKKKVTVHEKEVEEAIEQMRKMRRTEAKVERAATAEDVLTVDIEMTKDNVIVEGGTGANYKVYLSEPHYLPNFTSQLVGLSAGEEKTFEINFPEDHFQKNLAGHPVQVKVKATKVEEMTLPVVDDAFAQGVGLKTAQELREKLHENIGLELANKATEAAEIELLEKLADGSKIDEIPEVMINEEMRRMLAELRQNIENQGGVWEDYLSSIKKTADQLRLELVPQAIRRIKTALIVKKIAKDEKIAVEEKEVDEEIDRILSSLRADDREMREQVASPDYREYVIATMRNRKTLEWLKSQCVKEEK
jgi:trigger factor